MFLLLIPNSERTVFCLFHDSPFTRALVVDAAEVKDAVDNDAVKFSSVVGMEQFAVAPDSIQTDEDVAVDGVAFRVVKGDDVSEIVVLKILAVDFQYFCIVAEDIGNVSDLESVGLGNGMQPLVVGPFLNGRHFNSVGNIANHLACRQKVRVLS